MVLKKSKESSPINPNHILNPVVNLFSRLPRSLKQSIYFNTIVLRKLFFWGRQRYCPICENSVRKFYPWGVPPRPDAWCPVCGSVERFRLFWIFLKTQTDLFESPLKKLLHIAPEMIFESRLRQLPHLDYLTADLNNPRVMVQMDITDIQFPDNSFDVIFCNHVLEHIPEDRIAMGELYRVLKPGGWGILTVPIHVDQTYEDPTITEPEERLKVFGQHDHVRNYGRDYAERLTFAGFKVSIFSAADVMDAGKLDKIKINLDEKIFYCSK